jgi:hypothetical protein
VDRHIYIVGYHDPATGNEWDDVYGTMARARRALRDEGFTGGPTSYEQPAEGVESHLRVTAHINRRRVQ